MSAWGWAALVVGVVWAMGIVLVLSLARAAAKGDRGETVREDASEPEPERGERDPDGDPR